MSQNAIRRNVPQRMHGMSIDESHVLDCTYSFVSGLIKGGLAPELQHYPLPADGSGHRVHHR